MKKKKLLGSVLAIVLLLLGSFFGLDVDIPEAAEPAPPSSAVYETQSDDIELLAPDGSFSTKDDVALYIHTYGCLPPNYITKSEARDLGWEGGGLEDYAPGMCIGGDRFGNYEGLLPDKKGRKWTECDIDFEGEYRNGKRIVFSSDGLIYYTDDHYESFDEIKVVYEEKAKSSTASKSNTSSSASSEEDYGTGDLVLDLLDLWLAL